MKLDTRLYTQSAIILAPVALAVWLAFRRSMHTSRSRRLLVSAFLALAVAPTGWQEGDCFWVYPAAPMLLFIGAGALDGIQIAALFGLLPIVCLTALIFAAFSLRLPPSRTP
ncbi:MAG: hypothetical protein IT579_19690 [Verrucomicrobia subdivision 3 bacterium]|nr:hypothetical protein [Limisphaerales bacterium]